ncbi:MAG: hypothetical protein BGO69_05060 [Bacteroidetes bacterium 46-16]|nr:MAG: hypothetical protein BGO69_05060 [Bacteroidetes bacterium 46-16]
MHKEITYHWGDDHLRITLGNRIQPRIRILFWSELLATVGLATVFLVRSLPLTLSLINWISGAGALLLYSLALYRFLSRIFFHEEIVLSRYALTIIQHTPFRRYRRRYDWRSIGPLHYAGKEKKTDHPLKGRNYDYFGFETHEHVIQSLYHDGNLYFNYAGYPIRFARNVYSWDAEEMVNMMKIFAGNSLRLGPEWDSMLQEHEMGDTQ